ncbi:MAG: ATP-binding protein [Elusimicrobiota bacterium]|nr:ATP-binding protein [Elusimicrobiota bacterium]
MESINFTVDSALLKELGERLVGKPHIALAELIKNSYDADATRVEITFDPNSDAISVSDNGTGMDFEQFRDFWMRIGSPHKGREAHSRVHGRPLTGSKGVGRLAVQFLAKRLLLTTIPRGAKDGLSAQVDWERAVSAGDLTHAKVHYAPVSRALKETGTIIRLEGLRHKWTTDDFRGLAKEIWWLQPPFHRPAHASSKADFKIVFTSPEHAFAKTFERQIRAIVDIWNARLVGRNTNGKVDLSIEFAGERPVAVQYRIPDSKLLGGDFEIRIYHLEKRQPHGIRVKDARDYFKEYGGVHVYDAGFRLPYYGTAQSDWLRIEADHSHRLGNSKLLPADLHVDRGMNFLPTLGRIFGVVNVNTATERSLSIQITRDRLGQGKAYEDLVYMLRWAIDYYAMEEARRASEIREVEAEIEPTSDKAVRLQSVLESFRNQIAPKTYVALSISIKDVVNAAEKEAQAYDNRMALLGPLATAGISTLAYQHELQKQLSAIDGIIEEVSAIEQKAPSLRLQLADLKSQLSSWVRRAKDTQSLFTYLAVEENRSQRSRLNARQVLDDVRNQTKTLARGTIVDIEGTDEDLLLPKGSFAEWTAVFQNVFINAFNAILDSDNKRIRIRSRSIGKTRELLVEDSGCGVKLPGAEKLFEPFARGAAISHERQALGYGGTGLGLTIVKLVAGNLGCEVGFVSPDRGYNTAFRLAWREQE